MKKLLILLFLFVGYAYASPTIDCPEGTVNCSLQNMGDEYTSADNSQSSATQSNPSSNSNTSASNVTIDPKVQQSNNAVDQSGNRVTGTATGGAASSTGNKTDLSDFGNASSSVGNTSSNSGGNILGNDSSNTITSKGGSVGDTTSDSKAIQGQVQGQGIDNVGNTETVTKTAVDASDRSYTSYEDNSMYIHIPTHQAPPSSVVIPGQIAVVQTQCGPLTAVRSVRVAGVTMGWVFHRQVDLGLDDRLVPYKDPRTGANELFFKRVLPDGNVAVIGHSVIWASTVISVSAGKNFSFAGGGSQWGSGGAGTTSGMQRMVTKIDLVPCIFGYLERKLPHAKNIRK